MDPKLVAVASSVGSFGLSILQWLRLTRSETKKATIDEYLEWLRRENHQELLKEVRASQEDMRAVDALIKAFASQSEKRFQEIEQRIIAATERQHDTIEARLEDLLAAVRPVIPLLADNDGQEVPQDDNISGPEPT